MGKAIGKGRVWTVLLVMSILLATTGAWAAQHPDKAYDAGQEMMQSGNYTAAAEYFREAVALNPSAANWKALGDALEKSRNFEQAAEAFFNAADIYQVKGLKDDAEIYRKRGESLLSYLNVFLRSRTLPQPLPYTAEKYEPRYGAYIGAYIDEDPLVQGDGGFVRTNFNKFNTLTGKDNAIFFTYVHYGTQEFPQHWVDKVAAAGAVPELALEPSSLTDVQDDNYLRRFARAAGQTGKPIFIRFASEANGVWTPYHDNPQAYIEKFRLVSRVMSEEAPNVAMVWTVGSVPEKNILDYYPGDDFVDWVGVNIYSVAYHNGDINQPAFDEHPTAYLDYVYKLYSGRKPIQISEYGVTHSSKVAPGKDLTLFAIEKIKELYSALPRKYPRVKSINWFDSNNLAAQNVAPDRRNDNYSLTENQQVLQAYIDAVAESYYLSGAEEAPQADYGYVALPDRLKLEETVELSSWARTYDPDYSVSYRIDGQEMLKAADPPFTLTLSPGTLNKGLHSLAIQLLDSRGTVVKTITRQLQAGELAAEMVLQIENPVARLNGQDIRLITPPVEIGGFMLVPVRFLAESLGASVLWDDASQTASFTLGGREVSLAIGQGAALVDGVEVKLDMPARLINFSTMVPLRFVSESLGATVGWQQASRQVTVTY